jgi:putative protein-disulfide isomerase
MSERYLVYFADPMCAWCYGFGPQLETFLAEMPGMRLELTLGGLRPFNREPVTPAFREMLAAHWAQVRLESGLPVEPAAVAREGFAYDTEPASRAVVTCRHLAPQQALGFLKRVQHAFFAQGQDVTDTAVLADLAAAAGLDREAFLAAFGGQAMKDETNLDFSTSQQMGVTGFPTLAAGYPSRQFFLVASGFTRAAVLTERLFQVDAIAARGPVPLPHEAP